MLTNRSSGVPKDRHPLTFGVMIHHLMDNPPAYNRHAASVYPLSPRASCIPHQDSAGREENKGTCRNLLFYQATFS